MSKNLFHRRLIIFPLKIFKYEVLLSRTSEYIPSCSLPLLRVYRKKGVLPALTAFRSHIYDIVCHFDNVKIMLDNNDRIALIDQLVQHIHQHADILKVQSGGRLIKNIERLACIPLGKFGGKLHVGFRHRKAW